MCGTRLEEQKAVAVALARVVSSNDPFPGLAICPHSGVEVSEDNKLTVGLLQ